MQELLRWTRRNKLLTAVAAAGIVAYSYQHYFRDEASDSVDEGTSDSGQYCQEDETAFQEAAAAVKANSTLNLSDQQNLQLYALFKQAKHGRCTTPKPSVFDMVATAKWDAWHSLGGMSRGVAMKQYASKVEDFASGAGSGDSESNQDQGFSLSNSVSTMKFQDGDAKSQIAWSKREEIFELASEGKLEELRELLGKVDDNAKTKDGVNFVDAVDGSKRTPLHYAADREQVEVVKLLVESGATVDMKDEDGMTALLTAVMCEHEDIVKLLVDHGADINAEDIDGETPLSLAEGAIKNILSSK